MATVKQSITALFEQSQKSASDGQAMFAVIESEAVASLDVTGDEGFDIPASNEKPPIARRFDDLRDLAEREVHGEAAPHEASPPSGAMTTGLNELTAPGLDDNRDDNLNDSICDNPDGDFDTSFDAGVASEDTSPPDDTPETDDSPDIGAEIDTSMNSEAGTNGEVATPGLPLPSEPPAPAGGDALSDLDIGDIQELVRQAWEDETALAAANGKAAPEDENEATPEAASKTTGTDENGDDPDIEATMEEIAAAVVKSSDVPAPVDLAAIKADLVAAMRTELQAVVEADLRPMIKAAIAEALQELPAAQPKPRAKKATSGKVAKKKATTRAKKAPVAKKPGE